VTSSRLYTQHIFPPCGPLYGAYPCDNSCEIQYGHEWTTLVLKFCKMQTCEVVDNLWSIVLVKVLFFNCRYPPGHGDVFASLANSGKLDELIAKVNSVCNCLIYDFMMSMIPCLVWGSQYIHPGLKVSSLRQTIAILSLMCLLSLLFSVHSCFLPFVQFSLWHSSYEQDL
jgi:hypothetical protein